MCQVEGRGGEEGGGGWGVGLERRREVTMSCMAVVL